ncbi:cytochrome P450 [Rhizoctonia solani]|nr:cytochrome P450 [Rhizoctonia solani]
MTLPAWLPLTSNGRTVLYTTLALAVPVVLVHYRRLAGSRKPRHPPSPVSFPVLGHLLYLSSTSVHLDFMRISEQLQSDIIYLKIFGENMIILNSVQAASDILEKRSATYSDRLCPPFGKDPTLFDLSDNLAMLGCNDTWRHQRCMLNKWLNVRAVSQFDGLLEHQTTLLLQCLLSQSEHPRPFEMVKQEFFFAMGSAMLKLGYGYQLESKDDRVFQEAQLVVTRIVKSLNPTAFAVNLFPFLTHAPSWFPGTGWKRIAREWREHKEKVYKSLYEWTKSQTAGTAEPSVLGYLLQDEDLAPELGPEEIEKRLKELSIGLYGGGTETSSGTLMKFVAAMVLNPEVQAKAQEEIDSVIGSDTLPKMFDRNRLPYVQNLISEVLRWHTVSPTGLPHVCSQDDTYRGYDIEKGTVIMFNTWAMSRDKEIYKDPELFNPDRFLDPSVPRLPVFGWGRRICPGLHFAESTLFIIIASLLATFTFSAKKDTEGREIVPDIRDAPDPLALTLQPFEFELKPRSELHRKLITTNDTL